MEKEKNYKTIITILTVIIVILTTMCILFATGIINFKNNETKNGEEPNINQNINKESEEDKNIDNETNDNYENTDKADNNINQTNNYDEIYKDYHILKFDNKNQNNQYIRMNEK